MKLKTIKKTKAFKEKALHAIERISVYEGEQFGLDNEKLATPYAKFVSLMYRLAHAATDTSCQHPDWEKEVEEIYEKTK